MSGQGIPADTCLHCGQHRDSREVRNGETYCATVDYFGEVDAEWDKHHWADWSDAELARMGLSEGSFDEHRRTSIFGLDQPAREATCEREGHLPEVAPEMAGICSRCFKRVRDTDGANEITRRSAAPKPPFVGVDPEDGAK